MSKIKFMSLRALIKARKWANTERGERIISIIGATWGIMALCSFCLLTAGVVFNLT